MLFQHIPTPFRLSGATSGSFRMLLLSIILLFSNSLSTSGQDTEAFAKKIMKRMCKCAQTVKTYDELKPKLEECYNKVISQADSIATPAEKQIIGNVEQYKQVKEQAYILVLKDCEHVKKIVEAEAKRSPPDNAYPINFTADDLKAAAENPEKWEGKLVAFDAVIVEVQKPGESKPYMKVKFKDGQTLWVGSMVNSKFDKVGNFIRFIGYFTLVTSKDFARKYHNKPFHILAFGELDLDTRELAFLPGSEAQIKIWSQGSIPVKE